MGARYDFRCRSCGYAAVVSGGPDVGELARTVTISCATCKELHDVVVSEDANVTTPWTHPGPCPRCGQTLEQGELVVLWD